MTASVVVALLLATTHTPHQRVETGYGKPGYNPNKMICVSRSVIGSRLQSVRECHTAQQWYDQQEQEQVGLNRMQYNGDKGCDSRCAGMPPRDTPW
jgi:hypothetical protein